MEKPALLKVQGDVCAAIDPGYGPGLPGKCRDVAHEESVRPAL
ncbi:hypothetical protein NZJ93_10355 [Desulfofundulus thermocisternus]|nr:hypothetical protein [Desulfofundulus thermocisternus]